MMFEGLTDTREVLLQKIKAGSHLITVYGDITLSLKEKKLFSPLGFEPVGGQELCIAWILFRAGDTYITKDELYCFLYENDARQVPLTNVVEVYLARLRKRIVRLSNEVELQCWRFMGNRLNIKSAPSC